MSMEDMMDAGSDSADQDEHYAEAEKLIAGLNPVSLNMDQRLRLAQIHLLMSVAESLKTLSDAETQDGERKDAMKGMMRGMMGGDMNSMIRNYRE